MCQDCPWCWPSLTTNTSDYWLLKAVCNPILRHWGVINPSAECETWRNDTEWPSTKHGYCFRPVLYASAVYASSVQSICRASIWTAHDPWTKQTDSQTGKTQSFPPFMEPGNTGKMCEEQEQYAAAKRVNDRAYWWAAFSSRNVGDNKYRFLD